MSKGPIKRNENIVSLSREHHFSLLFGWKIKKGIKKGIELERIIKYANYFWNNHLEQHFRHEEETLFALSQEDEFIQKALAEHHDMKQDIEVLNSLKTNEEIITQLEKIADFVTTHVRFEERELFPYLENKLTPEQLKQVGHDLDEMTEEPLQDDYDDEFWQ